MKKVSIIVPVYNAENTIERCIESILKQSYNNIELILIDDGSNDNSFKIINKYKNKKNVVIIKQKNVGVSLTRNKGIKIANGEYIMFIDNDDFIDYDYVEKHINEIEKTNSDVVISGYRRVDLNNKVLYEERLKDTYWSRYIITAPWAKIFKKEFLVNHNIEFLNYDIGEDVYFNLKLYSFSPKVSIINYIGYNWFYNNLSVSNTKQKGLNNKLDILFLLNNILKCYKSVDEYLSYYLVRYFIWYLLYSGKDSNTKDFMIEYKRIKKWYKEKGISLKFSPFSKKIDGESLKNRLIIFAFISLEKMHLIGLFSKMYCKGRDNGGNDE